MKVALLDFDDVLFNTRAFVRALSVIFVLAGLSMDECETAYKEFRENLLAKNNAYNLKEHVNFFSEKFPKLDGAILEQELALLKRSMPNFVFEDVFDFLRHLSGAGWRSTIVSFGDESWQGEKIRLCGLGALVENIVISQNQSKIDSIEEILKDAGGTDGAIFIDDNRDKVLGLAKNKFPGLKTIQLIRPELESIRTRHENCDYDCRNLKEVKNLFV